MQSLGPMAFNFQELFMKFEGRISVSIIGKWSKVIGSNGMKKMLKNGHEGVITQLYLLDVQISKPSISLYLKRVIDKNSKVFEDIEKGIPPTQYRDDAIHFILGSVPPNIKPYRYPYGHKIKNEHMVEEMLKDDIIMNSQGYYFTLVVMVHKKKGWLCICLDYRELKKITIKDIFSIAIIEELLDELHGGVYFTKLDLYLGYH